jgi:hypothetical protein
MGCVAHHLPHKGSALLTRRRPVAGRTLGRLGASAGGCSGIPRVRIRTQQVGDSRPQSSSLSLERGALATCLRHSRLIQAGPLEPPLDSIEVDAPPPAPALPAFEARPSTARSISMSDGSRGPLRRRKLPSFGIAARSSISCELRRRARGVLIIVVSQPWTYSRQTIRDEGDEALGRFHPHRDGFSAHAVGVGARSTGWRPTSPPAQYPTI